MTEKIEVTTKYKLGHEYTDVFNKTDYHCPGCGKAEVWEGTCADYYEGVNLVCIACDSSFYLPNGVNEEDKETLDNSCRSAIETIKKVING